MMKRSKEKIKRYNISKIQKKLLSFNRKILASKLPFITWPKLQVILLKLRPPIFKKKKHINMTNYTKLFNFLENSEFFPKNKVLLLDLSLCLVILKSNLNKKSGRSYVNLRYMVPK